MLVRNTSIGLNLANKRNLSNDNNESGVNLRKSLGEKNVRLCDELDAAKKKKEKLELRAKNTNPWLISTVLLAMSSAAASFFGDNNAPACIAPDVPLSISSFPNETEEPSSIFLNYSPHKDQPPSTMLPNRNNDTETPRKN